MTYTIMDCCLGIESTAHTFGASVIKEKKILSNVKDSYTTLSGGLVPVKLADHHVEVCGRVISKALSDAGVTMSHIHVIAYSRSPGIGNALRIGASAARSLASIYHKPLVGVNHCIAHLEIGRLLTPATDPILLYVSGANTQVIAYQSGRYRIFGETLDNGIGNMIDGFARHIGLGFPGGPHVAKLAEKGTRYIPLPYSVKGMDISFAGIQTQLKRMVDSKEYAVEDLCYSLQETIFAMMCEVTERALAHCGKSQVILGGGVACNSRLQEMIRVMCQHRGAECFVVANEFNVDNAAMIAWNGLQIHAEGGHLALYQADIQPYVRTDEVEVVWRSDNL